MKFWENFRRKSYRLSTLPVRCSHCILENRKKSVSTVYTYFWLFTLSHKKTICNPLAHPTWKYYHTNVWINFFIRLKVRCVLSDVGCSEKSQLWRVATEMPGKQCYSKCSKWPPSALIRFPSFSTPFSRRAHHAVLKFSPRRNKPLPQASTRPY